MGQLNLIKLSVGSESVDSLIDWQKTRQRKINGTSHFHITRMWPRRDAELLDGGSIYWVVQGVVQCRQSITGLEEVIGEDGIRRCAILLGADIIRTEPQRKRPFQGWRYLTTSDAPQDLSASAASDSADIPPTLMAALADIGVR